MLTECFQNLGRREFMYFQFHTRQLSSLVKELSLDITPFFAGHCPMSGANIQTCT